MNTGTRKPTSALNIAKQMAGPTPPSTRTLSNAAAAPVAEYAAEKPEDTTNVHDADSGSYYSGGTDGANARREVLLDHVICSTHKIYLR